jgi:hypothetical protein
MEDMHVLRQGPLYKLGDGSVGVVHVWEPAPDGQQRVLLATATRDGQEHRYELVPGDRFPLGAAVWEVRGIEPGSRKYVVRIVRVDEAAEQRREELRDRWSISPAAWEQGQRRAQEDEQRERELFGGREPFAVPDSETDA